MIFLISIVHNTHIDFFSSIRPELVELSFKQSSSVMSQYLVGLGPYLVAAEGLRVV